MSKTISNTDLQAVIGYLNSYIALEGDCKQVDLKQYNYVRRAQLLRNKLKKKLSSS